MVARPSPKPATTPEVPLALWPVAQKTGQAQRKGRYLPASSAHPAKMLPELARRIISEYSAEGGLVCDPMAGIGTTVVEAAALGRRAVGVELEQRWAILAQANLDHALSGPARSMAEVRRGDACHLVEVLGGLAGRVDLVATSPPYGSDVGNLDKSHWGEGGGLCPTVERNYSADRANLGHARRHAYRTAMAEVYASCHAALRPGGLMAVVTKNTRRGGCVDLAALTVALAEHAGFRYVGHVVALLAAVRDGQLWPRPSFWQLIQLRRAQAAGRGWHLVAHEDVVVLAKPGLA